MSKKKRPLSSPIPEMQKALSDPGRQALRDMAQRAMADHPTLEEQTEAERLIAEADAPQSTMADVADAVDAAAKVFFPEAEAKSGFDPAPYLERIATALEIRAWFAGMAMHRNTLPQEIHQKVMDHVMDHLARESQVDKIIAHFMPIVEEARKDF